MFAGKLSASHVRPRELKPDRSRECVAKRWSQRSRTDRCAIENSSCIHTRGGVFQDSRTPVSDYAFAGKRLAGHLMGCVMLSRKRYVGPIPHLWGKTALVRHSVCNASQVMAQFEELYLQEARGWWQFAESDFDA